MPNPLNRLLGIIALLLLSAGSGFTQQTKTDSLTVLVNSATNDKIKIDALNALSKQYYFVDFKKSLDYNKKVVQLAKKINHTLGLADAYNIRGVIYMNTGKNSLAIANLNKAVSLYQKLNNQSGIANCYANIGVFYI
ncbi:MAG TPA: hypothetical protein VD905_00815 [Flavobacteriales bacterium]|nr:hypothetical protein [Flavobacteriales bacterium]